MKFYSILYNDKITREEDAWVVCSDNFSIVAFAFSAIWSFYRNLWIVTASLIALILTLNYIENLHIIGHNDSIAFKLLISLYVGLEANNWYMNKLQKSGYVLQDVVLAESPDQALLKFYSKSTK